MSVIGDVLDGLRAEWLVGGSVGAILQGVPLTADPRDLDIYADTERAKEIHQVLQTFATDEQAFSETRIYSSLLSHYSIEDVQVELVGGFRVNVDDTEYSVQVEGLLSEYAWSGMMDGTAVRFMPLAHELLFNVLRDREDRYVPIAATMKAAPDRHAATVERLLTENRIGPDHARKVRALLSMPEPSELAVRKEANEDGA